MFSQWFGPKVRATPTREGAQEVVFSISADTLDESWESVKSRGNARWRLVSGNWLVAAKRS